MQSASSSTASLLPSSKHWESSFGQLSSSYGFAGAVPSLPPKSTKSPKVTSTSVPRTQSSTPSYNQSSVVRPASKDYESAFGQLTSSYGFGGGVPCLPATTSKQSKSSSKHSLTQAPASFQSGLQARPSEKNYEAAFGNLASSFGFGGPNTTTFQRK
ncbi:hypothetical protein D9613_006602 [Agrocybe pediades]|uniref:Uncharacterized protein n=1 Tax=Agrocybe pediades TaxID=84607 RepID=A0A8H4QHK8_9AGAR|nr:hypothetical protein D9613_006602 [Agrocybe pediades]